MSVTTGNCCCAFNGHHPGGGFVTTRTGDEKYPDADPCRDLGYARSADTDAGPWGGIRVHRPVTPPVLNAHRDIPIVQVYGDIYI